MFRSTRVGLLETKVGGATSEGRADLCRNDDIAQPSAAAYFGTDADNGKPKLWKDIGVSGVGEL